MKTNISRPKINNGTPQLPKDQKPRLVKTPEPKQTVEELVPVTDVDKYARGIKLRGELAENKDLIIALQHAAFFKTKNKMHRNILEDHIITLADALLDELDK